VGTAKLVSVTGISAAGADYLNYAYNTTASTTSNITPTSLSVTADNTARTFGAADPMFTFSYNGFVNNETASVLNIQPTANTTTDSLSNAGSYLITPSGASGANYTISYVNGTLKILPLVMTADSFTFPVGSQAAVLPPNETVSMTSNHTVNQPIAGLLAEMNWNPSALAVTTPTQWGKLSVVGEGILMPVDSRTNLFSK
jgi:hypothetical protein